MTHRAAFCVRPTRSNWAATFPCAWPKAPSTPKYAENAVNSEFDPLAVVTGRGTSSFVFYELDHVLLAQCDD